MSVSSDKTSLNDCGCCETETLEYSEHNNRPGQSEIKYRLDTHAGFVHRMLARLSRDQLPEAGEGIERRPLAKLTTRNEDDPSIAILDAWGMVADVLAFYQERIANEGYIRTATERRSVLELARAIGYELNPGVAASTYLAFTADNSPGSPPTARVAKGTQVLSIPGKDEVPQTFETTEEIIARAEWNALKPYTLIESNTDPIVPGVKQLRLKGISSGLKPGDGILIVGSERLRFRGSERWDFRILTSVVPSMDGSNTLLSWEIGLGHIAPHVDPAASDILIFAFRMRTSIFGKNAAEWQSLPSNTKAEYLSNLLGPRSNISVSKRGKRIVFAGNNNALWIWTYNSRKRSWFKESIDIDANGSISGMAVSPVAVSPSGTTILLGHKDGALSLLRKSGGIWIREAVPDEGVAHGSEVEQVTFSTDNLLMISFAAKYSAKIWNRSSRTLRKIYQPRMTVTAAGRRYRVGSEDKVLTYWELNSSWSETTISLQAHAEPISSMAISSNADKVISASADGTLKIWEKPSAGTGTGTWSSQEFVGESGEAAHAGPIISVAFSNDNLEIISTSMDGITRLWRTSDQTLLKTFRSNTLDYLTEWPDFDLPVDTSNPQLTLGEHHPGIVNNSWIIISKPTYVEVYNVKEANTIWHSEFNISGEVTRLDLDVAEHLNWFKRRETVVFAQSEQLEAYVEKIASKLPIEGDEIELDRHTPELEAERMVMVSGKRMRVRIIAPQHVPQTNVSASQLNVVNARFRAIRLSSRSIISKNTSNINPAENECTGATRLGLVSADSFTTKCLFNNDMLQVMSRPKPVKEGLAIKWIPSGEGFLGQIYDLESGLAVEDVVSISWHLQDRNGFIGTVISKSDEIMLIPPLEDDEFTSEVALIDVLLEKERDNRLVINTLVRFEASLANIYDHDSVSINANVASASHGETVAHEVMGSGDGTRANQRFVLNKIPLTYISAPTPTGGESTLEVRVNNVLWQQAPSLFEAGPRSQSYIIRHDNEGNSTITFGDGRQGTRLPTGQENIVATYRSGIGPEGEVGSETLRLLKSKPLGIREVNNNLAATGAAAPEVLDDARAHAPLTVLTLDRIVSVNDFEDFAAAFAGIGKAQATVLWNGETSIIHITIATASGEGVEKNSILYTNLLGALDQARDTTVQVLVDGYIDIRFKVEAQILIDTRYLWENVQTNIKSTLNVAFTFDQRAFGQDVTEVEVLAIILGVEGVVAAELTGNKLKITKGPINPEFSDLEMIHLRANKARWDPDNAEASPGQLLLINPAAEGIILKEMSP